MQTHFGDRCTNPNTRQDENRLHEFDALKKYAEEEGVGLALHSPPREGGEEEAERESILEERLAAARGEAPVDSDIEASAFPASVENEALDSQA